MSPFSYPPLITACLFAFLGAFVYWRGRDEKQTKAYSLWCLTTVYWQACWTILFSCHQPAEASYLVRIGYSGIIFIPIAFYQFNAAFLHQDSEKPRILLSYAFGLLLVGTVWVDHIFLRGFYTYKWGYYPKAGILHPIYLLFLTSLVLRTFYLHFKQLQIQPQGLRRTQMKYVVGAALVYTLASVDFLVNYGIDVYPSGYIFTLGSLCIVAYSITKHSLMDITVIIRKTLVYSVVTGSLAIVYITTIAISARLFEGFAGYQTIFSPALVAFLVAFCFQPLRKRVQVFVDTKFFRQYVDREEKLYELSREVITHTTPESMGESLIRVLGDTMHPKSVALFLKSRDGDGFTQVAHQGICALPDRMPDNNPLTEYFIDHPQPFVQDIPSREGESYDTRRPRRADEAA